MYMELAITSQITAITNDLSGDTNGAVDEAVTRGYALFMLFMVLSLPTAVTIFLIYNKETI